MKRCSACCGLGVSGLRITEFPSRSHEGCLVCSKIAELDEKIEAHRQAIDALVNQRDQFSAHHNTHHDPFTTRIPPEIASRILTFAVGEHKNGSASARLRRASSLGTVSRQWRSVVLRTPQLWNAINVVCKGGIYDTPQHLLLENLARSGALPLHLDIDLRSHSEPGNESWRPRPARIDAIKEVLEPFFRVADRWQSLDLRYPSNIAPSISTHLQKCYNLREVSFELQDDVHDTVLDLPTLSPARVHVPFDPRRLLIHWRHVDHCSLDLATTQEIMFVIAGSPRLSSMKVSLSAAPPPPDIPNARFTHRGIQELEVAGPGTAHPVFGIWARLALPDLRKLRVTLTALSKFQLSNFQNLIEQSHCQLRELTLCYQTYEAPHTPSSRVSWSAIQGLLQSTPSLETLHIRHPQLDLSLLEHLAQTPPGNPPLLDQLHTIRYTIEEQRGADLRGCWVSLLSAILLCTAQGARPLRTIHVECLRVSTKREGPDYLLPLETLRGVHRVVERGIDLTIVDAAGESIIARSKEFYGSEFGIELDDVDLEDYEDDVFW